METVALTGLVKIELPDGDVLLCDGGFITWAGDTYRSKHPVFGAIRTVQSLGEGVGDEIPALEMVLMPAAAAEPGDLSQPGFQQARARFWIAEYDIATNTVIGTPDLIFDGQIDQTTLVVGRSKRDLAMSIVSLLERLFEGNIGNSLNPSFHKTIWPGETGHDQATGLVRDIAWGVDLPRRAGTGSSRLFGFLRANS